MWPVIVFFMAFFISTDAACDNKGNLSSETQRLRAELKLAEKPDIYFIFNLKERKIYIKARGTLLREFRIIDMKYWGDYISANPLFLLKKSTFMKPGREKIKPGADQDGDEVEIDALELDDMPARYTLSLEGGVSISVTPEPEGLITGLCNIIYSAGRYISGPVIMVWNALRKKTFTSIYIVLNKKEAQALYWSFHEGNGSIIYPP